MSVNSSVVNSVLSDPRKGTLEMRSALREMQESLTCTLCAGLFNDPVTLTCGHSFCRSCIDHYNCDNWNCPVESCGMPVTLQTGSYRKVHPALQTVMTSFHTICQTLNQAEPDWWKDCADESQQQQENQPENGASQGENNDDDDEEGMIDLFADEKNGEKDDKDDDSHTACNEELFGTAQEESNLSFESCREKSEDDR